MNPDLLLGIVAALAGFVLKTALAFGVCLAISWLAGSPNRRFTVWLGFLFGTAAYWLWMANGFLASGHLAVGHLDASAPQAPDQAVTSAIGALQIPGSWALPLGLALRVIGIAYLLVLICMLFTHIKKQRQLRWILRFTTKPPAEVTVVFRSLAKSLRVGRSKLLVLSGVASPATFGWIRPTILLPDVCLQQDRSELEDILRHELHHVRRLDFVWNGFAVVARALLFFHPAVWYAVRRMQFDRELACDLAVVSDSPGRRAKYAECLVHFARLNSSQDPRAWGIDFAASSQHLKARVQSVLAGSKTSSPWFLGVRIACGLICLIGFLGVAPSLAVLLSYTHQQTSRPLASIIAPSRSEVTEIRATRRGRLSRSSVPRSRDSVIASVSQTDASQPAVIPSAEHDGAGPSATQNGSGPQLLRRSSSASGSKSSKQQSIPLVDTDASGQIGKTGDHDTKQALQQSVTAAAGIYKRLGAVDRH
ncbi:MAG TPA: M56 family metallopeptidase [Edaphobacter sp.]|nr:M56 family metallopeptidase [Edaphobacter sp.]